MGDLELALEAMTIAMPFCHPKKAPVADKPADAPTVDDIAGDADPEMADEPRLAEGASA